MPVATQLPMTPEALDRLWQRHCELTSAIIADSRLAVDRLHMEAAARARRAFEDAYLQTVKPPEAQ